MKKAFRCKNCGHLETAANAGDSDFPHACRVCGSGVSFNPKTGIKNFHSENWEKLVDLTEEKLTELGLTTDHIEDHKPVAKVNTNTPKHVEVQVTENMVAQDKV